MDFDIGDIYDAIFSSQQRAAGLADASSGHDRLVEEQLNDLTENSEYLKELVELRRIADAAETGTDGVFAWHSGFADERFKLFAVLKPAPR